MNQWLLNNYFVKRNFSNVLFTRITKSYLAVPDNVRVNFTYFLSRRFQRKSNLKNCQLISVKKAKNFFSEVKVLTNIQYFQIFK